MILAFEPQDPVVVGKEVDDHRFGLHRYAVVDADALDDRARRDDDVEGGEGGGGTEVGPV